MFTFSYIPGNMTRCDIIYGHDDGIKGTLETFQTAVLQLTEMKRDRGQRIKLL